MARNVDKEIAAYMKGKGLPYELNAHQIYPSIASAGSQSVVIAETYHEFAHAGSQWFAGYYGKDEAEDARNAILNATPRKRFVQSVIIVEVS